MSATVLPEKSEGRLGSTSFIGLVLTQFFGAFNDNMFRWLAIPIAQKQLGITLAITLGSLALTLPFLIFLPMAGWLADRFSKRSVIVGCKVAEVVLMILGALCILYGNVWLLFALVALMGTQSALFGPAKFGSIPEMLPTRLLSKGNGLMGMATIFAVGLGTVAGFGLYDLSTPTMGAGDLGSVWPAALALIGVGVLGTLASLMIVAHPAADPDRTVSLNPVAEAIPAFRILAADHRLLRTAWGIAFFYLLASLAQMNIDPYGETILHLEKTDIGILMGILILGVGSGSILAGIWSEGKVELGIVPLGALGICFSSLFVYLAGSLVDVDQPVKTQFAYWGSCFGLFLLGTSAGLYSVPLDAYLQYRSEIKTRGMVLAGSYFLSFLLVVGSVGLFFLLHEVFGMDANQIFMLTGLVTIPVAIYIICLLPDWTVRFGLWMWTHSLYRLKVHGRERLPERGGGLIVCNHVSFVDGILICISSSRFIRFLVYADFTEMPFLRRIGKIMRVIPIRATGGPRALVTSLQTAREAVLNGELVCIFAEGQITRTGQMQPFQRGMMKIVQGTDAPVIPAYIHGLWGSIFSWRGGKLFWKKPQVWPYPVNIHFGEPIHNPRDAAQIRQEVERLGAEAVQMDAGHQPIPARRFIRHCKRHLGATKVVDSTKVNLTGGKLLASSLALRHALKKHVLNPGEKNIGLLLPPSVGGAVANMAVALNGCVGINLNYTLSEDVMNYCVDKAGIRHVLTSKRFLEQKPYTLQGAEFVFLEDLKEKISGLDKLRAAFATYALPSRCLEWALGLSKIRPDETLTIVFTSGSTGEPKGVVLSHANIGSNIDAVDQVLNLSEKDGLVGVLPFFHSFGYTACLWLVMCYRVRGIYHFNPLDAKVVGRLCQEHKATILMATPTFLKMYLKRCEKEHFESIDLIVTGAEKLPLELAKQFEEKFGILPTEGYGTTELSPVVAVNIPDHRSRDVYQQGTKLGTVGRPIPGVTARVVNPESGEDRGIGPEGLLQIKGPNVMQGYLDEPEKTAEVLHDGWYNTGDIASLDPDGFITITGRESRFSKIGGEMVPHIKIEQELTKLAESPEGEEGELTLAVTAVADSSRGERLVVLYTKICKPPHELVKELAATGMPKLWLPSSDSFYEVDKIPILGTGKLDLRGLKQLAEQATGAT